MRALPAWGRLAAAEPAEIDPFCFKALPDAHEAVKAAPTPLAIK
jgi:hypothetical protein